ncbi:sensor domain-containing diguanylate cyclase [bacterium]|nr:sensor domain-containing diguanylate cyclase [candidate division CSSED10-310 bacterium]
MRTTKVILPDRKAAISGKLITRLLDHPNLAFHFQPEDSVDADVVVVPFRGRNHIEPSVYSFLAEMTKELPIIGLESNEPEKRDWPVITMDLQIASGTPQHLIQYAIIRLSESNRRKVEFKSLNKILQRRLEEMDSLVELGIEFTGTLLHHELNSLIIKKSIQFVPSEMAVLFIVKEEKLLATLAAHHGFSSFEYPLAPARRISNSFIKSLKELRVPIQDINPFSQHALIRDEAIQFNRTVSSLIIAPIVSKNRLIGYLEMTNRTGLPRFSDNDIKRLEILTDFAAVAYENAYLYEKTEILAQIDDLTHVQNFEYGKNYLQKLIQANEPFSILFLDLDGFKKINKLYGHLKGNEALHFVSDIIRSQLDASDMACRFGGDEFMIMLPGSRLEKAQDFSKKLIDAIESAHFIPGHILSGSIGIATFPEDGITIRELIHAADKAMYHAKAKGSGHVTVYRKMNVNDGDV